MRIFTKGGARAMYGNSNCVTVQKPEGKTMLGRLIHRWENNIKMDGMV